ncbi:MAG: protein kinase domain-containing protein, partial [Pyrinomonadaceae bacterium]
VGYPAAPTAAGEGVGDAVGPYTLREQLGEGGMGLVYVAEQSVPVRRKVALKVIKPGMDSRQVVARFEAERQALALMDHPNIARVLDAGAAADGRPYFAMELVKGVPITRYCDEHHLTPRQRLELFVPVCQAVQHAHQKGIIHRDLKPPNILVTPDDRVKITDFGIVKLAGPDSADTSGISFGSPHYVSPEQAEGSPLDQRSDIYSLGVILYEMLAGAPPFGGGDGRGGEPLSRTQVLRAHVEQTPRRPSELNAKVTPELEAAVLRALEKKPERRFVTAEDFLRAVRHARGRDTGGIAEPQIFPASRGNTGGVGGAAGGASDEAAEHLTRDSYITQPILETVCDVCGTEADAGEERCRKCGHDLGVSPATAGLARSEVAVRGRSRGRWVLGTLAALAALGAGLVYFTRRDHEPGSDTSQSQATAPTVSVPTFAPTARPTPAPPSALTELRPARVAVDSSFEGYGAGPLTDGVVDVRRIARMRYNEGNWASAETPLPHWIELGFERPARLAAVYVYWGFDRNRYVPSRRVELQTPDAGGAWRTIATLEPAGDHDRAAFEFSPVETSGVRIFQPAQQGPKNRPFVMWVREVRLFGVAEAGTTDSPPKS